MVHPILSSHRNILVYASLWLLITIINVFINIFQFGFNLEIAVSDSLIYNISYAILGIGLWYNIRYKNLEKFNIINRFLYHTAEAVIISLIWVLLCYFVLTAIFSSDDKYLRLSTGYIPFTFLVGLFFYILLTLFYYLVISYQNLQDKTQNEANLQALIKEAELNLLKSQINPHFLFNSLNSINSLTVTDPVKAREMIIKLSEFLRHSLGHKEHHMVSLNEELEHLQLYLEIEKIRFGERLQYQFNLTEECKKFPIPIMLFQPLFENAIKHGVYESTGPIMILLNCSPLNNALKVTISNNFDPESPPRKGNRVGLKNVENRIKLVYQNEGSMKVNKQDNHFEVELILPMYQNKL